MAKFIHCWVNDTDLTLDAPLTLYRNALAARPVGHPDRPSTLIQLAVVHLAAFGKRRHEVDAAQVEALLHEAMDLTSAENHENRAAIFILQLHAGHRISPIPVVSQSSIEQESTSGLTDEDPWTFGAHLLRRFERFGDLADLQQAISVLEASVQSASVSDNGRLAGLTNLGVALLYRFKRLDKLSDLEQAISRHRACVDLTPDGHPEKPGCLNNLGLSFLNRFERLGELSDLEQAISRLTDAVDLTSGGHPDKPGRLSNLGNSFRARFGRLGKLSDLEQAISRYREAVGLISDSHPDKPGHLNNLGNSFRARFWRLGELGDLEQAISKLRNAIDLTPDGHPNKPGRLNNLGLSFRARFRRLGEVNDLEQAISSHRDAVNLTPGGHPEKPGHLNNLGLSFFTRFERLGKLSDLEQAISSHRDAVGLTPEGHPEKPGRLESLGLSFRARFDHLGELSDLEQAILRHREAIILTPEGHPNKPRYLNNLGLSSSARFERLGEPSDLEQAISSHRDAVNLSPVRHPSKPTRLNNLGNCFFTRFSRLGDLGDLEQAISMHRDAVGITSDGHPDKPGRLNNLGLSIRARFWRLGELADLDQAISRLGEAVNLTPDGHPDKALHLNNLGNSFFIRFARLGELIDLEQAVSCHTNAVDLTPDGHSEKPGRLNNLANSFRARFDRLGDLSDLKQAISRHGDAVVLTPDGHPDKPRCMNNLGNSFFIRFECLGELIDLEQAISSHRDAVDLTFDSHPNKPGRLNNLGLSFFTRFRRLGEPSDLEQAISSHRDAVDLTPGGHPDKPGRLESLADSFRSRFDHLGELSDLEQAISLYSQAACASTGPTTVRFRASQGWVSFARAVQHHSLLHAYSVAIGHLPQLAWIGLSLTNRYRELARGADIVREAAAAALDSGSPETAVEWLEQGRSIVWGELFQLRSSYNELSSAHPDHARRLRELSAALEHAGNIREKSLSSISEQTQGAVHYSMQSLEQEADGHRALAIERGRLLQLIRGLPGFERFLLHKEFSQLRASAHSGPVVILNAAERRCDALIVLAIKQNALHVPLPSLTFKLSGGLQNTLDSLLGPARVVPCEDRAGQPAPRHHSSWESILSTLWRGIVKPVFDVLSLSTCKDPSRIFWCPTGPFAFLPIHAAGLYGTQYSEPGHKAFDFVVSSYAPTLSSLIPPVRETVSSGDFRVLAVLQPPSDGQSRLPGVHAELEHIRAVIRNSPAQTTLMESSVGTVEEVLALMKDAEWVHFACHGVQDPESPSKSGLCLADERRLKLSDMISLSRPRGGLAFLSACQTAMGDKSLSDEAVHIAAGMLFVGYVGVIATMWSISDRVAPYVAKDVYEHLFRNGTTPDYQEAARALHDAVGRLRDNRASFVEWVPFVHVGL
ncbi:TPR-like protein [Boletus coccyginus]|nr:TPR-like protein [Boletus coccyginus]